ncbi:calpastatin-like isoform X4 [Polyodon spathula]|uniref:calpastatin-like isoform X4 n=1 Tax=Polyodon spathula TaxID=7913 RepID=UPI001B7F4E28|nr:calpastatin-like isoform X4 [Polyodon spathula]
MPNKSRKKSKGQAEKKAQAAATTSKAGGRPGVQQKAPGAAAGSASQSKPAPSPGAAQTATMKPTETKGTQAAKIDPAKTVEAKQPTASSASAPAAVKPKETTPKDQKPSLGTATATTTAAAAAVATCKESAEKKDKDVTGAVSASLKSSPKPPADKKAKVEESSGMSLDALDALGDTLGVAEVEPQAPKPLPKDIIQENLTAEKYKGRVGEREDSLPPNYRFGGTNKDTPIPKAKEEDKTPMDDIAALDALAGDFVSSATSPNVQSAPAPSAATPKPQQAAKTDPAKTVEAKQPTASSASAPAAVKPKETTPMDQKSSLGTATATTTAAAAGKESAESSGMSLDALDALGDTLGVAEVEPQAPKPLPKDIIQESLTAEKYKGRVGEREDSLPPNYRFGGTNKDTPIPKAKEEDKTPMDDMAALDALAGDFVSSAPSPNVHSAPAPSAATPKTQQTSMDNTSALDALAGDFVCPDVSPKVHAAAAPTSQPCAAAKPQNVSRQESRGTTAALDALSDTLLPDELPPAPKPVPASAVVKEAKVTEETLERLGDRDDTLPPEYRFLVDKDKDKNGVKPKEKPKETMGDSAALDALAGDFDSPAVAPTVQCTAAPTVQSSVQSSTARSQPVSRQESRGTTAALDALSDTLLPDELPPAPKPVPASAVVKEAKVTEETLERLGDRDDTLPPEYRFLVDKDKDKNGVKPKEKPKETMGDSAALDALAGDFDSPAVAPTVQCTAAPTVQSQAAPTVQSSTARSQPVSRQESRGTTAALDALSDTLLPDELPPAPKPVPASAVVKDKMTDKHQPKLGEDENTIPEQYRFKDEKGKGGKDASKQVVKPKDPAQIDKEKGDALDSLSMGFTSDSSPQKKAEDKKEVPSSTPAAAKPKTQSTDPSQPPKQAKQQLAETTTDPKKTSKS